MVTGSGGAAGAQGAAPQLTRCATPIGTAALIEQDNPMLAQAGLTSPIPLLRIMMAQSNCFRVVDRGQASQAMQRERAMAAGGDLQSGSNMGAGQMKAADFLITPNVVFKDANAGGGGAGLGALIPGIGGAIAGGIKWTNMESQVTLFLTNVRTGEQEAAAEGSASKRDLGFGGLAFGGLVGAGGGAYASTDIGKIVSAAFLDAHNKLVSQVQVDATGGHPAVGVGLHDAVGREHALRPVDAVAGRHAGAQGHAGVAQRREAGRLVGRGSQRPQRLDPRRLHHPLIGHGRRTRAGLTRKPAGRLSAGFFVTCTELAALRPAAVAPPPGQRASRASSASVGSSGRSRSRLTTHRKPSASPALAWNW